MAKKPNKVTIAGIPHVLVVFEVTRDFPNGTPRDCTRVPEEGTVRVDTNPPKKFITAYVPAVNFQTR